MTVRDRDSEVGQTVAHLLASIVVEREDEIVEAVQVAVWVSQPALVGEGGFELRRGGEGASGEQSCSENGTESLHGNGVCDIHLPTC